MEHTVIAVDIAKRVFQLHWVDPQTGSIERLKLKRAQLPRRILGGCHEAPDAALS